MEGRIRDLEAELAAAKAEVSFAMPWVPDVPQPQLMRSDYTTGPTLHFRAHDCGHALHLRPLH